MDDGGDREAGDSEKVGGGLSLYTWGSGECGQLGTGLALAATAPVCFGLTDKVPNKPFEFQLRLNNLFRVFECACVCWGACVAKANAWFPRNLRQL